MNNLQIHSEYDLLISEENSLIHKLSTCESLTAIIFEYLLEKGHALHVMAVEDVLIAIHEIVQKLQIELIHLRIQKNRFAFKMGESIFCPDLFSEVF